MKRFTECIRPEHRVLDLAAGPAGSFPVPSGNVILIDRHATPHSKSAMFVRCDAEHLPFRDQAFDVVIAAHCLEHFSDPAATLAEVKRVLKPTSALYLSLPDASTLTDKLYRWLYLGGGHVNRFVHPDQVIRLVAVHTGLAPRASRFSTPRSTSCGGRRYGTCPGGGYTCFPVCPPRRSASCFR